jgi:hypothetical protein
LASWSPTPNCELVASGRRSIEDYSKPFRMRKLAIPGIV